MSKDWILNVASNRKEGGGKRQCLKEIKSTFSPPFFKVKPIKHLFLIKINDFVSWNVNGAFYFQINANHNSNQYSKQIILSFLTARKSEKKNYIYFWPSMNDLIFSSKFRPNKKTFRSLDWGPFYIQQKNQIFSNFLHLI